MTTHRLLDAAADATKTETDASADRIARTAKMATHIGRRVAIVRNADIEAVLAQRDALLLAARNTRAVLAWAQKNGDVEAEGHIAGLDAAIAGRAA